MREGRGLMRGGGGGVDEGGRGLMKRGRGVDETHVLFRTGITHTI